MKREDFEIVRSFEDKLFLALRVDYFDEKPIDEVIKEAMESKEVVEVLIEPDYSNATDTNIVPEPEPIIEVDPKEAEITKLKEQLEALEALKELNKEEEAEIIEEGE